MGMAFKPTPTMAQSILKPATRPAKTRLYENGKRMKTEQSLCETAAICGQTVFTLQLCQQFAIEHGSFIVDLPIKDGDFHSYFSLQEGTRKYDDVYDLAR